MTKTPVEEAPPEERPDLDDTPPILGSWAKIYTVSLVFFAVLVLLFVWLTGKYS